MPTRAADKQGTESSRGASNDASGEVSGGNSSEPPAGGESADREREVKVSSRKKGPSEIVIYRDWCKACGICTEFCPTKVFTLGDGGQPVIAHPEKCISCDLCELLCPDFAITLHRQDSESGGAEKQRR